MEGDGVRHPGDSCREAAPRPHRRRCSSLAAPAVASAGLATITFRAVPLPRRALARGLAGQVRPRRRALARERVGAVQRPLGRRAVGAMARCRRRGGGSAGRRLARGGGDARLAASATRPGSAPSNGIRYRIIGRVRDLRASFVRSPELRIPLRAVASAGAPPIVPRSAWGADESIRNGRAVVRACDPLRERPPHGRDEQLLARPGGGDHARDRGLPRQVERLERHRLQLPRRPLRHRLRGPLRRDRPQRDRRATPAASTPARSASP